MSCLISCGLCKHKSNRHVYETNIGGNLYNLMKSLYCNSTRSIKIGENKTQPLSYSRGVRQGCILSPLLFNLYLNNLPHLFENTLPDPFVLPNGIKINSLLYADDLVILSRSKIGLQNCLNALSLYCDKWKLNIKNYDIPETPQKIY